MTKQDCLYALIQKKDSYDLPIITLPSDLIQLNIEAGVTYRDILRLNVEEGELLLYVESLKNIVCPINSELIVNPVIEYQVASEGLTPGFSYEDRLFCYYPGGKFSIDFEIILIENESNEAISETVTKIGSGTKESIQSISEEPDFPIEISMAKKAFLLTEPIVMTIKNLIHRPLRVVLECDSEMMTPKTTEIFLNENWNQEWFVKQSTFDRLLGKYSFKSEPYMDFKINIFLDDAPKVSQEVKVSLTGVPLHDTTELVSNDMIFSQKKAWIFLQYIQKLIMGSSKRHTEELFEVIKACLNYNPKDVDLRLLYVWLLNEYGHRKEGNHEFEYFRRYEGYYKGHLREGLIYLIGHMIERETISQKVLDSIDATSHWLEVLVKARSIKSHTNRYQLYQQLYEEGLRHSLMFAEVTALLNHNPMIPQETDELYFVTLKWAYNKKAISREWLGKIDHHYYRVENSEFMDSAMALGLYQLKESKNLLKLFSILAMKENRCDLDSLDMFKKALEQRIFLQDVEYYYILSAWNNKETVEVGLLKHFIRRSTLEPRLFYYVFNQVIQHKTQHPNQYRWFNQQFLNRAWEIEEITIENAETLYLLMDELIKNKPDQFKEIIKQRQLNQLKAYEWGQKFIRDILILILSENPKIMKFNIQYFMTTIIRTIGHEGIIECLKEQSMLYYKYLQRHHLLIKTGSERNFLPNNMFLEYMTETTPKERFLVTLLTDDFLVRLIQDFKALSTEDVRELRAYYYNYVAKKVILDEVFIDLELFQELYSYWHELDSENQGMLLALLKISQIHRNEIQEELRNLQTQALKHAIIVPWLGETMDILTIEHLTHPSDRVYIYYRYEEDQAFACSEMEHVAYGSFLYVGKLFYGETFQYYIQVEQQDGKRYIPTSDKIYKWELYEQDNERSDYRLDSIALSFEIGDESGALVLMEEQRKVKQQSNQLTRM